MTSLLEQLPKIVADGKRQPRRPNGTPGDRRIQAEAMCRGIPVVASDTPGVNQVVSRSGFG